MIIAVFRSRVAKEHGGEFERRYAEMSALVEAIPGYGSHERFSSPNGEDVLIVEFLTREAFDAWDKHPEHKKAKMLGNEPTRVFRRQFILSHATLADSSNWR